MTRHKTRQLNVAQDLVTNRHSLSVVNPWLSRWVVLCKDGHGKVNVQSDLTFLHHDHR